jgi:hypothetical protein
VTRPGVRRVALLSGFALAISCARAPQPSPQCRLFVDKILQCDPSSRSTGRDALERRHCAPSRLHCGAIDTSTAAGCTRFMGCLYDG